MGATGICKKRSFFAFSKTIYASLFRSTPDRCHSPDDLPKKTDQTLVLFIHQYKPEPASSGLYFFTMTFWQLQFECGGRAQIYLVASIYVQPIEKVAAERRANV